MKRPKSARPGKSPGPRAVASSSSSSTPQASVVSASPPTVVMIAIDLLDPTPDNVREIDRASLDSLAASIASVGVLQPIVVRPHPSKEGRFEIRAGERRFRAASLAGLVSIPAVVRDLDDRAALAVTIAENMQRENLHPLEEARTVALAIARGMDLKSIAAEIGKSVAFVARRASLTALSPAWQEAVGTAESEAGRLTAAHLELIARLPEETQDLLVEDGFAPVFRHGFPTVDELRRTLDGAMRTLRTAPWGLDDETLSPAAGACTACPKRSGCAPLLFGQEECGVRDDAGVPASDRCLDPLCWERKLGAHVVKRESALRARHPALRVVQIGFEPLAEGVRASLGDRIERVHSARTLKASDPNAVPALRVNGPMQGKLVHLDRRDLPGDPEPKDARAEQRAPKEGEKAASKPDRTERLDRRRRTRTIEKLHAALSSSTAASLADGLRAASAAGGDGNASMRAASLLLTFGTTVKRDHPYGDDPWKRFDGLSAGDGFLAEAVGEVVEIWKRRLGPGARPHFLDAQSADAERIAMLLSIDLDAMRREAIEEIPEPKSWTDDASGQVTQPAARKGKNRRRRQHGN